MTSTTRPRFEHADPDIAQMFLPKLVTTLREGYGLDAFRRDALAGLTVAVVALPLSMAIAIASGVGPERGLYTAIIGGFLVSALGGSRFQIGGPAGAFIVLVAASVHRHGVDGVALATMIAGAFLMLAGALRLGMFIKLVPFPVTVGFTAGIAVIIFASQIHDLLGLKLSGPEPGELLPKLYALSGAIGSISPHSVAVAALTVGTIVLLPKLRPGVPSLLVAVILAATVTAVFQLPIETIGTRFGGIPQVLPTPHLPDLSLARVQAVLPDAFAFALLGAIESLLSAVVADGMSGRRHRSNCELVAQGVANIGSGLFGGICVTGTIARTATNVRSGAHGPVSGILHSMFLLFFMLLAAPLASYIPLAALAGVLAVVAWNMIERPAIRALVRSSRGDVMVLLATFALTTFRDLTEGIVVGVALGAMLFIGRMSQSTSIEAGQPLAQEDVADEPGRPPLDEAVRTSFADTVVYRISGAFFFGAAGAVGSILDRIADQRRNLILDFSAVPLIDSTGANLIESLARKTKKSGVRLIIAGASRPVRRMLIAHGVRHYGVRFTADVKTAALTAHHVAS
ncbi:MAG: SulP family inorganic anion transporter [Hyphomicrobiaceae bacterium]|nr:SulP family inorganic anion transporter [Hyphomicrobiaceae bacterium]